MTKRNVIFCCAEPAGPASPHGPGASVEAYAADCLIAAARQAPCAARLRFSNRSFGTDILDENIVAELAMADPFLACFSLSARNIARHAIIARQLKLARPGVLIIAGGPEAFWGKPLMKVHPYLDCLVAGEGEQPFTELLPRLLAGDTPHGIAGVLWRDGSIIRGTIPALPARSMHAMPALRDHGGGRLSAEVFYATSRGGASPDPFRPGPRQPLRTLSLARVKSGLAAILEHPEVARIRFLDTPLDADPGRARKILGFIKTHRRPHQQVGASMTFRALDETMARLVAELFFEAPLDLWSVRPEVLRAAGRPRFCVREFGRTLDLLLRHVPANRLPVRVVYGLPRDTYEGFMDTLVWCAARCADVRFARAAAYPGSALYRRAARYSLVCDPEPSHLVYASDTFDYQDIVRMETVIVNWQVAVALFGPAPLQSLAREGLLPGILECLHQCHDDFDSGFTPVDHCEIRDVDGNLLAQPAQAFIQKKIRNKALRNALERGLDETRAARIIPRAGPEPGRDPRAG